MVALRYFWKVLAIGALVLLLPQQPARGGVPDSRDSLFAQSAAQALAHDFSNSNVSYLLADAETGHVLASAWDNADRPIPVGSLVKPFTALAYSSQYGLPLPSYVCRGTATHCWRPRGHGRLDLRAAIAYSCNSYFLMLASRLNTAQVAPTLASFGIDAPPMPPPLPPLQASATPGRSRRSVSHKPISSSCTAAISPEFVKFWKAWLCPGASAPAPPSIANCHSAAPW